MKHQNLLAAALFTAVAILPTASKADVTESTISMCKDVGSLASATIGAYQNGLSADQIRTAITGPVAGRVIDDALEQDPGMDEAQFALKWMEYCLLNTEELLK